MMTFNLRLKRISKPKHTRLKFGLEKLKDPNVLETFQAMIGGKFTPLTIMDNEAIIIINPITATVVGAPQMILQSVFSIFPCSPLPSGIWQTPDLNSSCKMVLARPDERET